MKSAPHVPDVQHVAVIGGGRWARVIADTLCGLLSQATQISIHSPRNVGENHRWAQAQGLQHRVQVSSDLPERRSAMAIIVANAARDHRETTAWALRHDLPVLTEKPVTLSEKGTSELVDLSRERHGLLCAAHVFTFASYIHRYANALRQAGKTTGFQIVWTDPATEERHGETKSYDPGLPVHADWLPHIFSILSMLAPDEPIVYDGLDVDRGGAKQTLRLRVGDVPALVEMERNGSARTRSISATTRKGSLILDFSKEPGVITGLGSSGPADPSWPAARRPLALMLSAFLSAVTSRHPDPRLDIRTALQVNQLIDSVSRDYELELSTWTEKKLSAAPVGSDPDLWYRLAEILQSKGRLPDDSLRARIGWLIGRNSNGSGGDDWLKRVTNGEYEFPDAAKPEAK